MTLFYDPFKGATCPFRRRKVRSLFIVPGVRGAVRGREVDITHLFGSGHFFIFLSAIGIYSSGNHQMGPKGIRIQKMGVEGTPNLML